MKMQEEIPQFLYKKLEKQYEENIVKKIIEGYEKQKPLTIRINTIKTNIEVVKEKLEKSKIQYKKVKWNEQALIIENAGKNIIKELEIYEKGEIYLQSLSSMIPPIILKPKEGENILDMAAAPGGKTTQIAAITNNKAMITACEKNKIRAERLKYNLQKQGVKCANIMVEDARKLNEFFSFDKILLDAPCSGSGTDNIKDEKFTEELIKRSQKTQEEMLTKALQILKSGKEMIYSTCSILKQENEEIIQKVLSKIKAEIVPIDEKYLIDIPLLPVDIKGTICVCPTELYEGFYLAKIIKK
ncbi:MAG: RsmB/NOP family class I SAM-dependent RNA methyltransferase [Clostridia bacterium]|nr:RsmB/NOP family class I SAM-dependent RNA methyltransferase [Clostridia bacterium]